ncbi:MAG: glycosyltransferase family 4 protein [Parcubacteria group bacterium]|nr:glycosyltransferase family 4 protein [Parcubacteria group bacterium]
MKLLIITQKYNINDSVLGVFNDWWNKLAGKLDRVYILALEKKSEPILPNIKVIGMGKEKGAGFLRKIVGFCAGLFRTVGKVDAILVSMVPKYVILAAPIAFIFRKPIYMWYTGVSANFDLRLAVLFCRKVFTAHKAAMRVNTSKRIITGHGIDTNKFQIPNTKYQIQDKINILSVGRITLSKGHDLIINAVSDLVHSGYNLRLKIIGGVIQDYHGKYLESLKKLVSDFKIGESVEFSGPVSYDKIPEYFSKAEILINAVPFGGLDKVVLEAMASGVIPLASNSAFSDVFPPNMADDLIFKVGDAEDLKMKLKNILDKKFYEDEQLRSELRNIVVKNHNLNNLIEKIAGEIKK